MSAGKKVNNLSESSRAVQAPEKAKQGSASDASLSKKSAPKRTADDLLELRDWKPLNHHVFVTKGGGTLRENVPVKTGEVKDVFFILGTCADHQVFVLQVWGSNARMISELFQRFALPDFEPTLWIYPVPTSKGLRFREGSANDFQRKSYGASFTVSLEYGKGESGPFSGKLATDAYPSMFAWDGGNYAVYGVRIPHYHTWGKAPVPAEEEVIVPVDYIPPMRTYDEASPEKFRRAPAQQTSSNGNGRTVATTDLSFEEED